MGVIIVILGFGWLIWQLFKDSFTVDITKNNDIDFRQTFIDSSTGKCKGKELDERLKSGYYNKKK